MDKETAAAVIKHPLFRRLPQNHKAVLLAEMKVEEVTSNALIYQQGSQGDSLYFIVRGTVLLHREVDGDPVPIFQLHPGETFGEAALIHPGPRMLTAKAIDSGKLARLPAHGLDRMASRSAEAALAVKSKIVEHFMVKIRHLTPLWEAILTEGLKQFDGEIIGRK